MFVPRTATTATLDELAASAQKVIDGVPLSPTLDAALLRGSSIGGARPKALLEDGPRRLIAKFSAPRDPYPIVQAEFVAMRLAEHAGLRVAAVEITEALGKRVLLVERFDRLPGGGRRAMVSALTILGLHDDLARYATYWQLANTIRARFSDPDATLHELFARITFNILVSNNDDHARNHAAFWDGETLALTPAYDICPQPRAGNETEQVMEIGRDEFKKSQVVGCVERAGEYHLTAAQARQIIDHQIETIERRWPDVCDEAELTEVDRGRLRTRQFLNPYATEGY
jgi:serine/threonine-protein kinase HipA